MSEFVLAGWTIALIAGAPAYLLLQIWTLRHLQGGWRHAALLPLPLMMTLAARMFDEHGGGAPAPAAALTIALIGALYLGALAALARLVRRTAPDHGSPVA